MQEFTKKGKTSSQFCLFQTYQQDQAGVPNPLLSKEGAGGIAVNLRNNFLILLQFSKYGSKNF
jgi:hypothetical protein